MNFVRVLVRSGAAWCCRLAIVDVLRIATSGEPQPFVHHRSDKLDSTVDQCLYDGALARTLPEDCGQRRRVISDYISGVL